MTSKDLLKPFKEPSLLYLEPLRNDIIGKLKQLQKATLHTTGDEITIALCDFLINKLELQKSIFGLAREITGEFSALKVSEQSTDEYRQLWEKIIELFESMHDAFKGEYITIGDYSAFLRQFFTASTVARPPQMFGAVTIGNPDRTRIHNAQVVFVEGVTDGQFPKNPVRSNNFTRRETAALENSEIKITDSVYKQSIYELYTVSKTLLLPKHKLYLVAAYNSENFKKNQPSKLFTEIYKNYRKLFKNATAKEINTGTLSQKFLIKTTKAAKTAYVSASKDDTAAITDALRNAGESTFTNLIQAVKTIEKDYNYRINGGAGVQLFSKYSYSPTDIEKMSQCRFAYYCRTALGVRSDSQILMNDLNYLERGSIVHKCLQLYTNEQIAKAMSSRDLYNLASNYVTQAITEYKLDTVKFDVRALTNGVVQLMDWLKAEKSVSNFKKLACEAEVSMSIGNITISGIADRIDIIKSNDVNAVRVIDYKLRKKEHNLTAFAAGLDLQTLLYLFAVCENPANFMSSSDFSRSNITPEGVYYVTTGVLPSLSNEEYSPYFDFGTTVYYEQKIKSWFENHPISCIVFDNGTGVASNDRDAVRTERQKIGGKKGNFKVTELSKNDYTATYEKAKSSIESTISKLQQGDIAAIPTTVTQKLPCEYCDYITICNNKGKGITNRISKSKKGDANE